MREWTAPWGENVPGEVRADHLLDRPAGKGGGIVVRDGHFYSGEKRVRFWGVNLAFASCFPSAEEADAVADRLARFGVNCVRFHHMDSAPYPRGIFADEKLETLSEQALRRLDYFVAALKHRGIYSNLNLHVSRTWSKVSGLQNADKLPMNYDKIVDVVYPPLIEANKKFARELLTHHNVYTGATYANEPAVAMVEINNEDSLFVWGGDAKLQQLVEPYGGMLTKLWNLWLMQKYGSREKLKEAWAKGVQPLGENLIRDREFADFKKRWNVEVHGDAKMEASVEEKVVRLDISAVDGTEWHLQFGQAGLAVNNGQFYTVRFRAKALEDGTITLSPGQAREPWTGFGASEVKIGTEWKEYSTSFRPGTDEENARVHFSVGKKANTIWISGIEVRPGGQRGLDDGEDPERGTVARKGGGAGDGPARSEDWYAFLQATDERYFVGMRDFLKKELGVKAPVTGTMGFGALGTLSQSKMDFVDSHAYWDHPHFPRKPWDGKDWTIRNRAMVDHPAESPLWRLAATRVAGKPFTVSEYNHAAPNDWAAECVPMIATVAALQDWDGVFLFAYGHNLPFEKKSIRGYFDLEGNPTKLPMIPFGARIFLGGEVKPIAGRIELRPNHQEMLRTAGVHYHEIWPFVKSAFGVKWEDVIGRRLAVSFEGGERKASGGEADERLKWTANGEGSGRFVLDDPCAKASVGFGPDQRFSAVVVVPKEKGQTIDSARSLLVCAVGRAANSGWEWDQQRKSLQGRWGKDPVLVEKVKASIPIAAARVFELKDDGTRGKEIKTGGDSVQLSGDSVWYEIERR